MGLSDDDIRELINQLNLDIPHIVMMDGWSLSPFDLGTIRVSLGAKGLHRITNLDTARDLIEQEMVRHLRERDPSLDLGEHSLIRGLIGALASVQAEAVRGFDTLTRDIRPRPVSPPPPPAPDPSEIVQEDTDEGAG